jgi:hypothetical protein
MDRNDDQESVNPGVVERELDETPMEGARGGVERQRSGSGGTERQGLTGADRATDRDHLQGGGEVERESVSGSEAPVEREGAGGGEVERDSLQASSNASSATSDTMMRASGREGGYGYDRTVDLTPTPDMRAGAPRDNARAERDERREDASPRTGNLNRDW